MATKSERIREAYSACARLVQSDRNASHWLQRAQEAATQSERRHRNAGNTLAPGARYQLGMLDTGRYFSVKWFLHHHEKPPTSYADAAELREDCFYGYAARDRICETNENGWLVLTHDYADVLAIDYAGDIAT